MGKGHFFIILLCLAVPCSARTIVVNANGTGDYPTIQAAINAANTGDTIELLPGTYTGDGNRDLDFLGKAITVRSIDPYDTDIVTATIIDCNGSEAGPHRGFYFHSSEKPSSVLEGLTIINGYAEDGGGAIYCLLDSRPTISHCRITNNSAGHEGGGIACSGTNNAVISHCIITNNSAGDWGGGIFVYYTSKPIICQCVIINNSVGYSGGGIYIDKATSPFVGGVTKVSNCIIRDNTAGFQDPQVVASSNVALISYSNIKGGYPGAGNIDINPLFANPSLGDYHLLTSSPCIDKGDPNYVPVLFMETDTDGEPQVMGDAVDMGVDEFTSTPVRLIEISATQFGFESNEGGTNPEPQILRIGSWSTINWTLSEDCSWVEAEPNFGSLNGGDYNEVALSVDTSYLTRGIYDCNVTISDPNAVNSPRTIHINLVIHGPIIGKSPGSIIFESDKGGPNPGDQILAIWNSGGGTLNWTISYDCDWMTVTPLNGVSTEDVNEFTLSVDTTGLTGGTHKCILTISDPNAENNPQTVTVDLFLYVYCFPIDHPDYDKWVVVGRPQCWCYPRQCHGDADGKKTGSSLTGYTYVGPTDLVIFSQAYNVKEPPRGPGIATVPNGICCDFAHDKTGSISGYSYVGPTDLVIFSKWWNVKEPPKGPGVDPNCLNCP